MERSVFRASSPPDPLEETLAGSRGADALRRLALEPLREFPEMQLIRTKYKPTRKLSAYYLRPDGRHAATVWSSGSVTTTVSPDDPAMPQLAVIHEREQGHVHTIRYRPGQRHVLRVTAPGRPGVHVKIDRDDSGSRSVPIARALGPYLAERCPGALLAEPVEFVAADRSSVWRTSDGAPMRRRLDARLMHLVGRAVRVLHEVAPEELPSTGQGTGARDAQAEVAATIRAGEHISALLPTVGADYLASVGELATALDRLPSEAPTFTHGDLKADNMLTSGESVRLLDLDRCGTADPALDLGKLVADLRWWCARDDQARTLDSAFRDGYGECDPSRWERATLLAGLFQLKLAARRCAVHDPAWESQVRSRVAAAAPVLARGA